MQLNNYLKKIYFKIDHLSLMQRNGFLIIVLLIIFISWYFLLYKPQSAAALATQQQIISLNTQTQNLKNKNSAIMALAKSRDMDKLIAKYMQLNTKLKLLNQELLHFHHRFINETEFAILLNCILRDTDRIKIKDFSILNKELPIQTTQEVKDKPAELTAEKIYYSLKIEGTYFEILKYLIHLETLKWQLFWEKFDYQVTEFPKALVSIEFYILKQAPTAAGNIK